MSSKIGTARKQQILNPPENLFGSLDPTHESNFYVTQSGEKALSKDGKPMPVKAEERGQCSMLAVLVATPYRSEGFAPWKAENALKLAVRSGMDRIKEGKLPLTELQAEEILWRLYTGPKNRDGSRARWLDAFLPILADVEDYLVNYLRGEATVAKLREAWGFKAEEVKKSEAEILAEIIALNKAEDEEVEQESAPTVEPVAPVAPAEEPVLVIHPMADVAPVPELEKAGA